MTLAEIGKRLGKKALEEVANIVKPDYPFTHECARGNLPEVARHFSLSNQGAQPMPTSGGWFVPLVKKLSHL